MQHPSTLVNKNDQGGGRTSGSAQKYISQVEGFAPPGGSSSTDTKWKPGKGPGSWHDTSPAWNPPLAIQDQDPPPNAPEWSKNEMKKWRKGQKDTKGKGKDGKGKKGKGKDGKSKGKGKDGKSKTKTKADKAWAAWRGEIGK